MGYCIGLDLHRLVIAIHSSNYTERMPSPIGRLLTACRAPCHYQYYDTFCLVILSVNYNLKVRDAINFSVGEVEDSIVFGDVLAVYVSLSQQRFRYAGVGNKGPA